MATKQELERNRINNEKTIELLKQGLISIHQIAKKINTKYDVARRLVSNIKASNKYDFKVETIVDESGWHKLYQIISEYDKKEEIKLKEQWFDDLPKKILREDLIDWFLHRANKGYVHKIGDINQLIKEAKKFKIEVCKQLPDGKVVPY